MTGSEKRPSRTVSSAVAIDTAGGTCVAHGHRVGSDGREAVQVGGELWCRQCAEFYGEDYEVVR